MRPKRQLRLWGAVGLSLGIIGPTLAMAGNGQGTVAAVGKAVPLVFVFGAIGIALIAHGFIRLTQRYNHAGSTYALVGMTVGPRTGFISGFCVMITYVFFSICTLGALGSFLNAFLAAAQGGAHPYQLPWIVIAVAGLALSAVLNTRDLRVVTRVLLTIEGVGILCMIILAIVIFATGGTKPTGVDFSSFSIAGNHFSGIMGAVVAAFLSWAGFEGCAALGEETNDPKRNIPRALLASVALTAVLFVVVMFAQTVGFGTGPAGLKLFSTVGNSLTSLGQTYVGVWFSLIISFAAVMSAFACHLSSSATSSRLLYAFSRDGLGPKRFAQLDGQRSLPLNALVAVLGVTLVVNFLSWATGWPGGSATPALNSYFYFATAGAICLMVAYLLVEVGTISHLTRERREKVAEVVLPVLGGALMITVFYFNLKGQTSVTAPVYLAFAIVLIGVLVAFFAPGLAHKVGEGLSAELGEPGGKELPAAAEAGEVFPATAR